MKIATTVFALAVLAAGCASYSWRPAVPEKMRTVQVPTFRNGSDLTETGSVVTRQVLREFQREGTFRIVSDGAALEVQGEVLSASSLGSSSNYKTGSRFYGSELKITAKVSVIDKVNGRVLIDSGIFTGTAPFSSGQDSNTAMRDASGRAADDLAQRLVDALLRADFSAKEGK